MAIQNYTRIYDYISDYQRLLYDFYSKHAVAFQVTYYNHDTENTVWDNDQLFDGSYEITGELSGRSWNKILLLPVYFMEEINTVFDAQDIGYVKDGRTSFVIPNTYGITPYPGDFVKFDQTFLRQTNDIYPIFRIEGVEIHPNTDYRQWKLTAHVYQSETTAHLEPQVTNTYSFVDYDKTIHTLADAQFLTRMLVKNEQLRANLKDYFDQNSGFYFL